MKKIVLLVFLLIAALFVLSAGRWLVVQDQVEKSDYCHALSGGDMRTTYAIGLYHQGQCGKLFFAGGREDQEQSHSSLQRAAALAAGVPDADILIDEVDIFSTVDEIERLDTFLRDHESDTGTKPTVSIVTGTYHSRRASLVANWYLHNGDYRLLGVPDESSGGGGHWLSRSESRGFVPREYIKLIFYYLAYRFPFKPLNDWLLGFERIND